MCAFSAFLYHFISMSLCFYEAGRQVLFHFADGDQKAGDKIKHPSCAYRGTLCQSQYLNAPCLHAAHQGLIAFEAVQLEGL